MAVKIIGTGVTELEKGIICLSDLTNMKNDFKNNTNLSRVNSTNPVVKNNSFYFTKAQFLELFEKYQSSESKVVKITIGIQKDEITESCGTNLSNGTAAIVEMVDNKNSRNAYENENDFILVNGFHNYDDNKIVILGEEGCCPSVGG